MKYINHKQTWTLFDMDGDQIAKEVRLGWTNEPGVADELAYEQYNYEQLVSAEACLIREGDEGDYSVQRTESIAHSALLYSETYTVRVNDVDIGRVEYVRECDMIENDEFDANVWSFDAEPPHRQLAACDENNDDREEWDEEVAAERSCPRCRAGRLISDDEQLSFTQRRTYECSECDLNIAQEWDASSVYIATSMRGQNESITVYRSEPLGCNSPCGKEPLDTDNLDAWWEEHQASPESEV